MALKMFLENLIRNPIQKQDVMLIYLSVTFESFVSNITPIGILSIGTVLKQDGFKIRCLTSNDIFGIKADLRRTFFASQAPKVIGFSVDSDNIHITVKLAEKMRKWLPNTTFIVGGPLATIEKEKILEYKVFDYCSIGEGEYSIRDFCRAIIRGEGDVKKVPGIYYRDHDKICLTAPAKIIENLDDLPQLDYSLSGNKANNMYLSGRGCPFNCAFCTKVMPEGYRYFSSKRVVSDIIRIAEHGETFVKIGDDTFIANVNRVKEVCEGLIEEKRKKKLDFKLYCEGRVDIINKHPELIDCLKEAGLIRIQIGIESGLDETLKAYNKRITTKEIEDAVELIYTKKPIIICGNLILSAPFDTYEKFRKSLDFMKKLINKAPGFVEIFLPHLCPYPKTAIREHVEDYGLDIIDTEWVTGVTCDMVSCIPKGLTEEDILKMRLEANNEINNEYDRILRNMPYEDVLFHLERHLYGGRSVYYNRLIMKMLMIEPYFKMKQVKNGCRLDDLKPSDFKNSYPTRVMMSPKYTDDCKGFILDITQDEHEYITDELEKQLYLFSFGKLNVDEIADRFTKLMPEKTKNEIIENFMIPTYRKWEDLYHLFFVY